MLHLLIIWLISGWEPYSVIWKLLCQVVPLQMIPSLCCWGFSGQCLKNFLGQSIWKMEIYALQLARLFHKQFIHQVLMLLLADIIFHGKDRSWRYLVKHGLVKLHAFDETWVCLISRSTFCNTFAQSIGLSLHKFYVISKSWLLY